MSYLIQMLNILIKNYATTQADMTWRATEKTYHCFGFVGTTKTFYKHLIFSQIQTAACIEHTNLTTAKLKFGLPSSCSQNWK